jgi:O-antigen biosynthesis protein
MSRYLSAPTLSIITLCHDGLNYTQRWLDTVRSTTTIDHEIIVVDNLSTDATLAWLRDQTDIQLLETGQNASMAAANNAGLRLARGAFLILSNNDTRLPPLWDCNVVDVFQRYPGLGMLGAGIDLLNDNLIEYDEPWPPVSDLPLREITMCGSTFCVVTRRVYAEVGPIDESYPGLYFEDTDWSLRIRSRGRPLALDPRIPVAHARGATSHVQRSFDVGDVYYHNRCKFINRWGDAPESLNLPLLGLESAESALGTEHG